MKEQAQGERQSRAEIVGDTVRYQGQVFPLGKAVVRTAIPGDESPNRIKALRLRLEELAG